MKKRRCYISTTEIAVIGCGVIGLTSAIRLQEAGYAVTIMAREIPPHTTSDKAGAIWLPAGIEPVEITLPWAAECLRVLRLLAEDEKSGVTIKPLRNVVDRPLGGLPDWAKLLGDPIEIQRFEGYPEPYVHGFEARIPFIDVPTYMPYLVAWFERLGGRIESAEIANFEQIDQRFETIVNCSGLGARELADDGSVVPKRGQTVLLKPLAKGLEFGMHLEELGEFAYFFPRANDVLLGGTRQIGNWDEGVDPLIADDIVRRISRFLPEVADQMVLKGQVGLRPLRPTVRFEREGRVIHNYGHGGIGHSLAWGCAEEVKKIIKSQ